MEERLIGYTFKEKNSGAVGLWKQFYQGDAFAERQLLILTLLGSQRLQRLKLRSKAENPEHTWLILFGEPVGIPENILKRWEALRLKRKIDLLFEIES